MREDNFLSMLTIFCKGLTFDFIPYCFYSIALTQKKIPRLLLCNISRHLSVTSARYADEAEDKNSDFKLDLAKPKKREKRDLSKKIESEQASQDR